MSAVRRRRSGCAPTEAPVVAATPRTGRVGNRRSPSRPVLARRRTPGSSADSAGVAGRPGSRPGPLPPCHARCTMLADTAAATPPDEPSRHPRAVGRVGCRRAMDLDAGGRTGPARVAAEHRDGGMPAASMRTRAPQPPAWTVSRVFGEPRCEATWTGAWWTRADRPPCRVLSDRRVGVPALLSRDRRPRVPPRRVPSLPRGHAARAGNAASLGRP